MGDLAINLHFVTVALRYYIGVALIPLAALAALAWLERSRRINPFGAPARTIRAICDPLLRPVERRMARFGRARSETPWWALLILLVAAAMLVGILGWLSNTLGSVYVETQQGSRGIARLAVGAVFTLLEVALLVRVIMSWVGGTYSRIGRLAASLTDWMLVPLRRILPTIGMIDISPMVAWFGLSLVHGVILRMF